MVDKISVKPFQYRKEKKKQKNSDCLHLNNLSNNQLNGNKGKISEAQNVKRA